MDEPRQLSLEDSMIILFCIGFAAGAGVLPYSRAEELITTLARSIEEGEGKNG